MLGTCINLSDECLLRPKSDYVINHASVYMVPQILLDGTSRVINAGELINIIIRPTPNADRGVWTISRSPHRHQSTK